MVPCPAAAARPSPHHPTLISRSDVTVLLLDRPRHAGLVAEIREAGARIRMISDGDVGGAIETAKPGAPIDVLMGEGGPERGGRTLLTQAQLARCLPDGTLPP